MHLLIQRMSTWALIRMPTMKPPSYPRNPWHSLHPTLSDFLSTGILLKLANKYILSSTGASWFCNTFETYAQNINLIYNLFRTEGMHVRTKWKLSVVNILSTILLITKLLFFPHNFLGPLFYLWYFYVNTNSETEIFSYCLLLFFCAYDSNISGFADEVYLLL